jgi:aminobenzoyl-glutamate utilization protein B
MQNSDRIWQLVDARKDAYEALSDRVWGMAEICYTEYRSMAEHRAMLDHEDAMGRAAMKSHRSADY